VAYTCAECIEQLRECVQGTGRDGFWSYEELWRRMVVVQKKELDDGIGKQRKSEKVPQREIFGDVHQ
jgi:hypothetical protein